MAKKVVEILILIVLLIVPTGAVELIGADTSSNLDPYYAVLQIWVEKGILPAYYINGTEVFDIFNKSGRILHYKSTLDQIYPVYKTKDVATTYEVKYHNTSSPVLQAVWGGPYTYDKAIGYSFQVTDYNNETLVYAWKPGS